METPPTETTPPTPPTPPTETTPPGPRKLSPKDRAPADPPRRGPGRPKLTAEQVRERAEAKRRQAEGSAPSTPPPPPPPFDRQAVEGFLRAGIAASNATLTALEVSHVTSLGYPAPRADQLLLPLSDAEAEYGVQCGAAVAEQWAPEIARYLPLLGLAVWSGTILVTRYLSLQRLASMPKREGTAVA